MEGSSTSNILEGILIIFGTSVFIGGYMYLLSQYNEFDTIKTNINLCITTNQSTMFTKSQISEQIYQSNLKEEQKTILDALLKEQQQ